MSWCNGVYIGNFKLHYICMYNAMFILDNLVNLIWLFSLFNWNLDVDRKKRMDGWMDGWIDRSQAVHVNAKQRLISRPVHLLKVICFNISSFSQQISSKEEAFITMISCKYSLQGQKKWVYSVDHINYSKSECRAGRSTLIPCMVTYGCNIVAVPFVVVFSYDFYVMFC